MYRFRAILISCCLLLWAATAHSGTVAIIRVRHPTPAQTEALSRLRGELLSVGLEVKLIERPMARGERRVDPTVWLEKTALGRGFDAVIELVGDAAPVEVDVWVVEKPSQRLELSRVALEPTASDASERLAIRAVEVLRSTFLEHEMVDSKRTAESDPSPDTTTARSKQPTVRRPTVARSSSALNERGTERGALTKRTERFSVEVGATVLTGLGGVGPAILPIGRAAWAPRPWLELRLAAAGFGTRPNLQSSAGSARVSQQFAVLGGCYRIRPDHWLWPFVAVSFGVLHTAFEGQANSPLRGHALDHWSFLMDGSLGAGLRFLDRYYLTLSMHVQVAEPYVAVHFVDRVVAKTGRPNVLMSLTLGTWL